jgi:hypothetical protein
VIFQSYVSLPEGITCKGTNMVRSQPRTDLVGCLTRYCGSSCYIRGTQDTQKPVQVKHDSKGCLVHGSERGNTTFGRFMTIHSVETCRHG